MAKVIGIVNLHSDVSFKGLTERRPVASVSFLGRYGMIDFVLSNLSNSNIDTVGVLIKEKPRSLFKHMGFGNAWNFNSKSGGVSLLYNEQYANSPQYNHDVNNLIENIAFLKKSKADYVVIAPAHIITTMNYQDVIKAHEKSGAKVTVVYQHIENADEQFIGGTCITFNHNKVERVDLNKGTKKSRNVSLETYVFNCEELERILLKSSEISSFFNLKDILTYLCDEIEIYGYEYKGYVRNFNSLEAYYKYSLEFLDFDVFSQVFKSNWPIYTNTNDTPPSKYLKNAQVKKSFIANGVIVDGTVEGSIIGRNVTIGKGAVVKNCILLSGSKVCEGAYLENVILDKEAHVLHQKQLVGNQVTPLYVKEGDVV